MIRVICQPEPANFNREVRIPGNNFLKRTPTPSGKQFQHNEYWKKALRDLETSYKNICSYLSFYIPGSGSVDHYLPKSSNPSLAYEWSNYRLAHQRVNSNKGNSIVLDPCTIGNEWFFLDIATFYVIPNDSLSSDIKKKISDTIRILRLNDDPWVGLRFSLWQDYKKGFLKIEFLKERYPFMAVEFLRQGI